MKLSNRNSIHSLMLVLSLCADCLMALPATAMAYPPSNNTVYSVRSFPATTTTRRDLTRESVSTDVQSDSDWGGIENLIVPQTKSQAEKDAEAKAQPGDILANGSHAAIYIGNGMVMNAMSPSQGTGVAPVSMVMYGGYAIRRIV